MAALGLDGRARVALTARWRLRDGSHCGSGLSSVVPSRRSVPLSVDAPMNLAWLARRCGCGERSRSHGPALKPCSHSSCPVPIVATVSALSMTFACATEKMPTDSEMCNRQRDFAPQTQHEHDTNACRASPQQPSAPQLMAGAWAAARPVNYLVGRPRQAEAPSPLCVTSRG